MTYGRYFFSYVPKWGRELEFRVTAGGYLSRYMAVQKLGRRDDAAMLSRRARVAHMIRRSQRSSGCKYARYCIE
jgi:hypothetical protein